jgi:uncharacterized protein (TIGR03437 family)
MKKTLICSALLAFAAFGLNAQEGKVAESVPLLGLMQAQNEVPALNDGSNAGVVIWLHGVLENGKLTSGSVDFDISTRFSGAVTVTGLHIHKGAAGTNGAIVIPTDVNATDKSIAIDATGRLRIQKQVQFPSGNLTPDIVVDLLAHPDQYYVNIHTTVNPGGAMRSQLSLGEGKVFIGMMSTKNEVPPVTANGSAVGSVALLRARDAGRTTLAFALFTVDYTGVDAGTNFTGLHIHNRAAGTNGGVIINTGLSATNTAAADPSGTGTLSYPVPMSPLDSNWTAEQNTVDQMFIDPRNQYINIHTDRFGGGIMRDQMRLAEQISFPVVMSAANEVPAVTGLTADSVARVNAFVIRNADGSIPAGMVMYDVNFRGYPANTTITGLHIHRSPAGANGGIVIQSGVDGNANKVVSDTGSGNITRFINVGSPTAVTALNDLVANPNGFYVNIHTSVNPGGAQRSQLTPALAKPSIGGVANNASTVQNVAPGAVISIYGTALSPIDSDLSGFSNISSLATGMNGVSVTIGGMKAPLYGVFGRQINVQVPFEVPTGQQPVVVTTSAGASNSFNVNVVAQSPSIFILDDKGTGAVVKNADFSLVTADNRAKAGDVLVVYLTGLGQTTPSVTTGGLVVPPSGGFNNTGTVTVTIGGQNATVVYSIASPNFAGLYQTAVTVPSGLTGSSAPLILRSGTTASNTVNIAIQ